MLSRFSSPCRAAVLAGVLLAVPPAGAKEPHPLPAELALLPADAELVVSARVARLWAGDAFRSYRHFVGQGVEELGRLFGFRPDEVERLTVFVRGPDTIALVSTTRPIGRNKILQRFAPEAAPRKVAGKSCYRNEEDWTGVAFLDEHTVALGSVDGLETFLTAAAVKEGPQAATLRLAAEHDFVLVATGAGEHGLRALVRHLPASPAETAALLRAEVGTVTADVGAGQTPQLRVQAALRYPTATRARDAVSAARRLRQPAVKAAAQWKEEGPGFEPCLNAGGADALAAVDGAVRALKVHCEGRELSTSVTLPTRDTGLLACSLLISSHWCPCDDPLDPTGKGRKDLTELAGALLAYHKDKGHLPPHALYSRDGKTPLLSWRVLVLPYLGDEGKKLYRQFRLDEPWDGPHNIRLVGKMPPVFALGDESVESTATTVYQVLTGPETLFDGVRGRALADASDGPANTILIAQGFERVPWTKPQDLAYAPGRPLPHLGQRFGQMSGFLAAFGDGAVRRLPAPGHGQPGLGRPVWVPEPHFDAAPLRALITRAGGEKVDWDALAVRPLPFHPPGKELWPDEDGPAGGRSRPRR